MTSITLAQARDLLRAALTFRSEREFKPLAIAVLDCGANLIAFEREDGASLGRYEIAFGKAYGALALGVGSRALMERAEEQPYFVQAASMALRSAIVPVPGGVIVRSPDGSILGAVGVSGDTSNNDESAAQAAIEALGMIADTG